jgi:FkbM family methyltransferase
MNLISKKELAYEYENSNYSVTENNSKVYFLKQRGHYYAKGINERTQNLVKSYNIDKIEFYEDDLIVDVGANNGDLIPYFIKQKYIGFEPAPAEFNVLYKNKTANCTIYNNCAGDVESITDFFISSLGADSSLYRPTNIESIVSIKIIRLDNIIQNKVKLLKVDAEGAEFEVINGAKNIMHLIEFIAIDLGFEKGEKQESTAPEVFNLLYKNHFKLLEISKNERYLFQNSTILPRP